MTPLTVGGAALGWLGRKATPALAVGVFGGVLLPDLAAFLRPVLLPSIALLLVLALLRLDWRLMGAYARRPGVAGLAVGWQLLASPVLVWVLATAAGLPAGLTFAMVLGATASPIMSAPAIAHILGMDGALVVVVVVATTLLFPLTLLPMALLLLDMHLTVSLSEVAWRAGLFILMPFAVAWAIRRGVSDAAIAARGDILNGVMVVVLLAFAIALMDGIGPMILADPHKVALYLAAAYGLNIGLQVVTTALFWPLGRKRALSVGLMAGNRNLALVLAVGGGLTGADFLLLLAVGQFPIFTLPMLLTPVYRRLLRDPAPPVAPT